MDEDDHRICDECPYMREHQERRHLTISEDQLSIIADRAADKAARMVENNFYLQLGKSVVSKALLIIGAITTGVIVAWREGWRP